MNSVGSIGECLESLRNAGVGQIVVVDARSNDGTRAIADRFADVVLEDDGIGLGNARNQGIAATTGDFVLNCGSDNIVTESALIRMIETLEVGNFHGVSAITEVVGDDYVSQSMNDWRRSRFRPGEIAVIGTPTLFRGQQLRETPFDPSRQHSDDAELCERWASVLGARFAISDARIIESGKTDWAEIKQRCRNYGFSDYEIFRSGKKSGWGRARQFQSLLHPARVDFFQPATRLGARGSVRRIPFLLALTSLRYQAWIETVIHRRGNANE
jgi:glycosyltransferase involved in cell wall biosynthesis